MNLAPSVILDKVYRTADGDKGTELTLEKMFFAKIILSADYRFNFDIYDKSLEKEEKRKKINENIINELKKFLKNIGKKSMFT